MEEIIIWKNQLPKELLKLANYDKMFSSKRKFSICFITDFQMKDKIILYPNGIWDIINNEICKYPRFFITKENYIQLVRDKKLNELIK